MSSSVKNRFRVLKNSAMKGVDSDDSFHDWTELEKISDELLESSGIIHHHINNNNNKNSSSPYIPGSGLTKWIYNQCESLDLPLTVLVTFVTEGGLLYFIKIACT